MNIEVSRVSHHARLLERLQTAGSARGGRLALLMPSQTISAVPAVAAHSRALRVSPGCVIRYGIAPYPIALWSIALVIPTPLSSRSSGNCVCQTNTATLSDDQQHREDREPARRQVVLERDHRAAKPRGRPAAYGDIVPGSPRSPTPSSPPSTATSKTWTGASTSPCPTRRCTWPRTIMRGRRRPSSSAAASLMSWRSTGPRRRSATTRPRSRPSSRGPTSPPRATSSRTRSRRRPAESSSCAEPIPSRP